MCLHIFGHKVYLGNMPDLPDENLDKNGCNNNSGLYGKQGKDVNSNAASQNVERQRHHFCNIW